MASCGVVWYGVVWRGVVWFSMVWCGLVWCGVMLRVMLNEKETQENDEMR